MTAILCALLSGLLFYLSTGVNVALWPLAWLAPVPILWLAYGKARGWRVFAAAFAALMIGHLNIIQAYLGLGLDVPLTIALAVYALVFAGVIMLTRLAVRRLPPLAGVFAFPCLWVAWEWLVSVTMPDGSFGSWAYSQVAEPAMIQTASLIGPWSITFLITAFASALALALHLSGRIRVVLAGLAAALFAANLGYGLVRLNETSSARPMLAAAIASDRLDAYAFTTDQAAAARASTIYAAAARALARRGAQVIVLPEKFATLKPEAAAIVLGPLQAVADETGALIVAGYDERGVQRLNRSIVLRPLAEYSAYSKRRMVPGLERMFEPGDRSGLFGPGLATVVCKDMDFPQMLRADAREGVGLMLVPAWDFDRDSRAHAAMAILRGVEGGYSIVRAARNGWVSISDDRGRVLSRASTAHGALAVALARVSTTQQPTLYLRSGDAFAWACAAAGVLLVGASVLRRRRGPERPPVH